MFIFCNLWKRFKLQTTASHRRCLINSFIRQAVVKANADATECLRGKTSGRARNLPNKILQQFNNPRLDMTHDPYVMQKSIHESIETLIYSHSKKVNTNEKHCSLLPGTGCPSRPFIPRSLASFMKAWPGAGSSQCSGMSVILVS